MPCLKLTIDRARCNGHGLGANAVPEVFALDAEEKSTVLVDVVPAVLEERVREALMICPEGGDRGEGVIARELLDVQKMNKM